MLVEVFEFRIDLFDFKSRQALQTHIENRRRLLVAQTVVFHKFGNGVLSVAGFLQKFDDCVDIFKRDMQSEQYVLSFLRFFKVETRSAHDYVLLVSNVAFQHLFEVENARYAVYEREHDHTERRLHLRLLVELIEKNLRVDVLFEFDDDTHTVSVRFFSQIADAFEAFVFDLVCDVFDESCFVDLIRQLGDDDLVAAIRLFHDLCAGTHVNSAAAGAVCGANAAAAHNDAAGREVRALDVLHQAGQVDFGVIHQGHHAVDDFPQVVRRNVGGHTDRNALAAVDQQVREAAGQYMGLLLGFIKVGVPVDGVLLDIGQHLAGHLRHTGLGITVSSRGVTVHGAEVTLTIYQRVPQAEILCQTNHRIIDGGVAVGVVGAQHRTDGIGRFAVGVLRVIAALVHRVQNTAVHGLEAGRARATITDIE